MLDLIVVDGHAKGIITRNLATGETKAWTADAVLLCTVATESVYYLSTNAIGCASRRPFGHTGTEQGLPTPASPKFIRPAYRSRAIISPS